MHLQRLCFVATLAGVAFAIQPWLTTPAQADDGSVQATAEGYDGAVSDLLEPVEETAGEAEGIDAQPASFLMQEDPIVRSPVLADGGIPLSPGAIGVSESIFASGQVPRSRLPASRLSYLPSLDTEIVTGADGLFRVATDGGNMLGKSLSAPSVRMQQRTPVMTDPRVRGFRAGGLLASGSYWMPARQDLDTLMSKIDSRILDNVLVVKGPYAVRYGPGFSFIDFQLLESPRFDYGYESHGSTVLEYKTNGAQWYARQSVWGGNQNWGYRIGYGARAGDNYRTGSSDFDAGGLLPTSYKSGDLDVAIGMDLTADSHLEFTYLRQDQSDVLFPGLIFDINWLVTDGFEMKYVLEDQPWFDRFTAEGWYNRTNFEGDTSRDSKNHQMPSIRPENDLGPNQFLSTNVDGMSTGYRFATTWGDPDEAAVTVGTDMIRLSQQLNDIVPETSAPIPFPPFQLITESANYPIPRSHSTDFGLYLEHTRNWNDRLRVNAGARADMVSTTAREIVPGMGDYAFNPFPPSFVLQEQPLSTLKQAPVDQEFYPWAVYLTMEYALDENCTLTAGAGHSMRPPTLTELYAAGPFIGSLQPGLTYVEGDPLLNSERLTQIDLGMYIDRGEFRVHFNGFYGWVNDYITYDEVGVRYNPSPPAPAYIPGESFQQVAYTNTDLATLWGFEFLAEQDVTSALTGFAVVSYVEGTDQSRSDPSRIGSLLRSQNATLSADDPRSLVYGVDEEPLPGIMPLEARLGLRLHQPCPDPNWGVELEARVADQQNRVAWSLHEAPTPGFTVWNLRSFWRPFEDLTLLAGVENLTDKFYREHLDYRAGRGVWREGVNFYFVSELMY